jgi:2-polyprenyl-3-methyl-5-hydroxy-6-metoxy-1,4-benzoquinol methylase
MIIVKTVPIQNLHDKVDHPGYYIRTVQRKDAALPEYDPLADLYDLEYPHDYDVPSWLALAKREGGLIVEWGAGTGRIAIPLAGAGFDVTGVELSERMIEEGRKKGGTVEWVHGDMRSVKLGRRYKLATPGST